MDNQAEVMCEVSHWSSSAGCAYINSLQFHHSSLWHALQVDSVHTAYRMLKMYVFQSHRLLTNISESSRKTVPVIRICINSHEHSSALHKMLGNSACMWSRSKTLHHQSTWFSGVQNSRNPLTFALPDLSASMCVKVADSTYQIQRKVAYLLECVLLPY